MTESSALKSATPEATSPAADSYRFLTTAEVMERLGIRSRSTLLRLRRNSSDFPKPRRRGGDSLCWLEHEIHQWMRQQPLAQR